MFPAFVPPPRRTSLGSPVPSVTGPNRCHVRACRPGVELQKAQLILWQRRCLVSIKHLLSTMTHVHGSGWHLFFVKIRLPFGTYFRAGNNVMCSFECAQSPKKTPCLYPPQLMSRSPSQPSGPSPDQADPGRTFVDLRCTGYWSNVHMVFRTWLYIYMYVYVQKVIYMFKCWRVLILINQRSMTSVIFFYKSI